MNRISCGVDLGQSSAPTSLQNPFAQSLAILDAERHRRAGERVLNGVERFLSEKLRLKVNRAKSAVDRPWNRMYLGYTFTHHHQPKFKVSPESVKRFKGRLR